MRISETIKMLEEAKKDLGDLDVCLLDTDGYAEFSNVEVEGYSVLRNDEGHPILITLCDQDTLDAFTETEQEIRGFIVTETKVYLSPQGEFLLVAEKERGFSVLYFIEVSDTTMVFYSKVNLTAELKHCEYLGVL